MYVGSSGCGGALMHAREIVWLTLTPNGYVGASVSTTAIAGGGAVHSIRTRRSAE
jgi:hypothetical protein